jgi:hypothetical protein
VPLHCTVRENRSQTRIWTAKKAIQVACSAISHGASKSAIIAGVNQCGPGGKDAKDEEALQALIAAAQELEAANLLIDADIDFYDRFATAFVIPNFLRLILARIPRYGPALVLAASALREVAAARLTTITAQKAANEATIRILRRAAANEARFLRTGT